MKNKDSPKSLWENLAPAMREKRMAALKKKLPSLLLSWFSEYQRPLPWRQTTDPYAIWVSEIMLQQTQVATVTPYFLRFMGCYPSVQQLAAAPLEEVLRYWAGLGYYSRVARMHATAQFICTYHHGRFPQTRDALLALPGIGKYTAGAIASIAWGESVPVVDGNVMRVLTRLLAIHDDIAKPATHKMLWAIAGRLVPAADAGTYNQALMELGATLCVPRNLRCKECPVQGLCMARRRSIQDHLPVKSIPRPPRSFDCLAVVIEAAGKVLLLKRPPGGLWPGLWEFPTFHVTPGRSTKPHVGIMLRQSLGLKVKQVRAAGKLGHQLTHRTFKYHIFHGRMDAVPPQVLLGKCDRGHYRDFAWVTSVTDRPCGTITRKIHEAINGLEQRPDQFALRPVRGGAPVHGRRPGH